MHVLHNFRLVQAHTNKETNETVIGSPSKHSSRFMKKKATWQLSKAALYIASMNNNGLINIHIDLAEDE